MRLKTPRPTPATQSETRAAPRDSQAQAKVLMKNLMRSKGLDADEMWIAHLSGWAVPTPTPSPVLVRLLRVEVPSDEGKAGVTLDYVDCKARLMRLPASQLLALYRFVLERNFDMTNTSFAVCGEDLYLTSRRPLADLDESELDSMIGHTISAVNLFLPTLLEQFDLGAVPL